MRLLLSLILLLGALPVRGATGLSTPVFTNFFQDHFIVAPNAPPTQIIKSRIFGPATNIFNLTTNIYNNSYFVESNVTQIIDDSTIIITNTTINITNVTFIVNGQTNDITQLWRTNAQGIYFPAITNTATIVVGQNAETWWSPTLADGFVSIHDASVGDSQFNSMAIAAIDNVLQENYGTFTSTLGSGAAPAGAMQLLAATNFQNPSAPISKFSVALQPAYGEVLLDLMNNGVHEFAVSNQITSVQALQLVPITNATLALGANQINVQSNSFISLESLDPDPTLTTIALSTGLRDGMVLLLKNVGVALGFTLPNGSPLYDDPTKFVTLPGGTWVSTNYGDSMLLAGGLNGWTEVKRWGQDTNVQTEQLWELVSGHMRTVPDTLDDWQFRSAGLTNVTIGTNGSLAIGPNTLDFFSTALTDGTALAVARYTDSGEVNAADIESEVTDSLSETYAGQYTLTARTNSATAIVRAFEGGVEDYEIGLRINRAAATPMTFNMTEQLTARGLLFSPAVADSASALAYRFDTVQALTDAAARLVEFKNAGTNQMSFGPDARITFGEGGTNQLALSNGHYLHWTDGGTDTEFRIEDKNNVTLTLGVISGSPVISAASYLQFIIGPGTDNVFIDSVQHAIYPSGGHPFLGTSTNRWGGLILEPITKVQKTALTPQEGMIVMQSDNTPGLRAYINGAWVIISTAADP